MNIVYVLVISLAALANAKRCQETKPLEDREEAADLVFTGKVLKIYRKSPYPKLVPEYNAVVLVFRVLKGDRGLERNPVVVAGLGNKEVCDSDVKERDSRIFLVCQTPAGYLRLNSSLLRMSMDTLDSITAAIKNIPYKRRPSIEEKPCESMYCSFGADCLVDELTQQGYCRCQESCPELFAPVCGSDGVAYANECLVRLASCLQQTKLYVRHHGQCDVKDPCEHNECRFGAVCKPSLDGASFECVCPEKCSLYGNSRSSRPVCGTDGRDYPNTCELKKTACREMRSLEVRYTGRCDPCQGVECPNSQVCQLDDHRNAICRCNAVCSEDLRPVCGSDGRTYANECTLRVEACRFRKNLRIVYPGECSKGKNPCESLDCGPFEECHIDKYGIASCQCQPNCESVMKPVCGSNGQTYSNECELQRNACMQKSSVVVVYKGPCGDTGPCHNYICSFGAICVLKSERPGCECPTCTESFEPVCGTDGMSYSNECKMKREACEKKKEIGIAYMGLCNTCSQTQCEYFAQCELDRNGRATCVCPQSCVKVEAKVCGNDGVTYKNECELRVSACTKQQYITVASRGPCDLCVHVHCKHGARCEDGRCVCPTECPDKYEAVCGSDGATYANECEMRRAACTHTQELSVLFYGECDDVGGSGQGANLVHAVSKPPEPGSGSFACEGEPCRFGGICDYDSEGLPQCVCPFECPAVREPVCGSDGSFYDSECVMRLAACRAQRKIAVVPKNRCQKRVEIPCDGDTPLINPVSGVDYYCGDGPDSKQCPPSSYCHKTSEFAKCCKEVIVIKSCADTVYGCCPDGKTTAQGMDMAGCPSQCNCNKLGSYSVTCDPATLQCPCKPGVGGLRCDRCEPGYWGLHRVTTDGNSGCTPCDCNLLGSVRDDCEQMTGRCVCKHAIKGMKCDVCPIGTVLGPDSCMDASIAKTVSGSCDQLECFHGAQCKEKHGESQCICDFKCNREDRGSKTPEDLTVCGTDGNSYGSECQLRQFSCRYQKSIEVVGLGPCSRFNVTQTSPLYPTSTPETTSRRTAPVVTESKIVREVTESPVDSPIWTPFHVMEMTTPPTAGIGMPLFSGKSYLELPRLVGSSRLSIELEIRTLENDGIILYNAQTASGKGDYLSLAIKDGFVEFKYDLGSGGAVLRSSQRLQLGRFHRITASRYLRKGELRVDRHDEVLGTSMGEKNFLNLGEHLYLGYVPGATKQTFDNIGVSFGFNGCIRHLKIDKKYVDLKYPGTKVLRAEGLSDCSDDSCTSMPCLNGASCILSGDHGYSCECAPSFTGHHCEIQLDPCASEPCSYGSTCISLQDNQFSCICPPGSSGLLCEIEPTEGDESGVMLDFQKDGFVEFPSLPSGALSVEMWFMTRSPHGLLLYNGQKPNGVGDFIALTLMNGFLHFTYNLGSGTAHIPSPEPVSMGVWHSVKISRFSKKGMLQVDHGPIVSGSSTGIRTELNLGEPLYIGGVPEFAPLKYTLVVQQGLDGVVQRVVVNDEVWEDLLALATVRRHVLEYVGPPCLPDTCGHGGRCIPKLDEFKCLCKDGYTGRFCNQTETVMEMSDNTISQPVKFDGATFMQFSEGPGSAKFMKSKENNISITFRTRHHSGLLLWMNKGNSLKGDYLAVAIVRGYVQLSFNLGKEVVPLIVKSHKKVQDNKWHTVVIKRNKRQAYLVVDNSSPIITTSKPGATELNTDGTLWIGGSSAVPSGGLPAAYSQGFRGCIASVRVDGSPLHLADGYFNYCSPSS